jgi:hypothetical protein
MALVLLDRVQDSTTTTGTGTITLSGTAPTGYQSFASIGNGNTTYYTIVDQVGANWEVGIGTYTSSGTTLSRTTVLASSNSGSLVNFTAGTKNVFCDYPAGKAVYFDASGNINSAGQFVSTVSTGTAPFVIASTTSVANLSIGGNAGNVTGTVAVGNGGTGITTTPSNGQVPIGNGTNYTAATLTGGNGISITNASGSITINGTGSTLNSQTGAYVLVASDAGKTISITTGGVTVNNSVFSAGNIVTIFNNSASSQTITQGTGVTMQWAGQTASQTGSRTLGLYGLATLVFISASSVVISGAGLT